MKEHWLKRDFSDQKALRDSRVDPLWQVWRPRPQDLDHRLVAGLRCASLEGGQGRGLTYELLRHVFDFSHAFPCLKHLV